MADYGMRTFINLNRTTVVGMWWGYVYTVLIISEESLLLAQ